ncbi:hypothetical protein [Mesorhizobium sp. LjNodule214]|uniref:hypothetical protein n=1 Tax=Mesorhizobium sp. LjNodule214 TaxID=3342252 RepID=UPI003ED163EC
MNQMIINKAKGEQVGANHIACEPERPPAGTFWGNENYKVAGYYFGLLTDRRDLSYIAEPIGWYPEYETAVFAAQQAGDGFAVGMSVSIVDFAR